MNTLNFDGYFSQGGQSMGAQPTEIDILQERKDRMEQQLGRTWRGASNYQSMQDEYDKLRILQAQMAQEKADKQQQALESQRINSLPDAYARTWNGVGLGQAPESANKTPGGAYVPQYGAYGNYDKQTTYALPDFSKVNDMNSAYAANKQIQAIPAYTEQQQAQKTAYSSGLSGLIEGMTETEKANTAARGQTERANIAAKALVDAQRLKNSNRMGRYTEAEIKFAGEPKYETITDADGSTRQVRIEKTPEEFIAALDRIDMAKNRSQTQDNSGISILTNFGSGRSEQNQPAYSAPALPQPTPAAAKKPVTPKAPAGVKKAYKPTANDMIVLNKLKKRADAKNIVNANLSNLKKDGVNTDWVLQKLGE